MVPPGPLPVRRGRGRAPGANVTGTPRAGAARPRPSGSFRLCTLNLASQGPYRPPALSGKADSESVGQAATGPVRLGVGRAGPGAHRRNPEV